VRDTRARDRRVQKTRRLLLQALGSLLHEKRYDAIVVQDILDRADVGRSTFYTHFRDKDDLLQSAVRDVLRATVPDASPSGRRSEQVLRFSRPMFEHIAQHLRAAKGGMGTRSRAMVHERLRQALAERVAEEVGSVARRPKSAAVPTELVVKLVTSTFVVVLDWWVERGGKMAVEDVDEVFRALVLPSLAAAIDG
jgi:AcrR family transcriptional regulator